MRTLTLLTLTGCVVIRGDGTLTTETRTVSTFHAVDANNGVEVDLSVDPTLEGDVELQVSTDRNLLDRLLTEVRGGTLTVDVDGNTSTKLGLMVQADVPSLDRLTTNNGAVLTVSGIEAGELVVSANNGSVLVASGVATSGQVEARNGADVDLTDLAMEDVDVDVNDGAVVDVCASGRVSGSVANGGVLTVHCGGSTAGLDVRSGGSVSN